MRCKNCGKWFSASDGQSAPGGSSSPGCFFILGLLPVAGMVMGLREGYSFLGLMCAVVAGCFVVITLNAMIDCCGIGTDGKPGGTCAECGHHNRVWPWSL